MAASSTDTADLAGALSRYLSARHGTKMTVGSLEHLSLGWESDVYSFGVDEWDNGAPRVLRLYFGNGAARAALREFQALRLLADAGYPVPAVDLVEPTPGPLGRTFLVMEQVAGGPLWASLPQLPLPEQIAALTALGALLAQLHQIDLAGLPSTWPVRVVGGGEQIDYMAAMAASCPVRDTDLAFGWLHARPAIQAPPQLGLVHWDYHPNNVLQDADGKRWVIDWTQFQATDVRFDLAWTLLLVGGHGGQQGADALLAGYTAAWPTPPTWLAEMDAFVAAACAKRVLSVVISLLVGPDRVGMRPGAEAAMRQLLPDIAGMYRRWLTLTGVALPESERLLADYL